MSKKDDIITVLKWSGVCRYDGHPEDVVKDAQERIYNRASKSGSDLSKGSSKSAIIGVLQNNLGIDVKKGGLKHLIKWAAEDIDAIRTGKEPPNIREEFGDKWREFKEDWA